MTTKMKPRWTVERRESFGFALGAYFVAPTSGSHDLTFTLRCGRSAWSLRRARTGQPWPEVDECYEYEPGHRCPQHDPGHEHTWEAGRPRYPDGPVPVRCVVCGARKCDMSRCVLIRHHVGRDHSDWLGYNGAVASGVSS